jgi:tripartite-type tricarboxylate transporter receptor subunit TctC
MLTRRSLVAGASIAFISSGAPKVRAQAYPTQTIRIIAGYPAGGGIDIVARMLAEPLKTLGQPVIVENRTGAAGMIAAQTVAKAAPDGHTLLMATSGEIAISYHLYKEKMTYDPMTELAPVALIGIVPCVVVVAETTPVRTPQELIAYARANPKKLSFSSSGVGNPQQLAGELMNIMAGTDVLHVPYRGAVPGGGRRGNRRCHHEPHQSRRGAAADRGRQDSRSGRHLDRAHAATAERRAAAGGGAGAQGL